MDRLKAEVVSIRRKNQTGEESPGLLPGFRSGSEMAAIEGNEISCPSGTSERIVVPVHISGEGSFVATGIHIVIKYSSQDTYYFTYYPNISFEYSVNNSHRKRQNLPIPIEVVDQSEHGMGYFPLIPQDVFPRGSTIEISINPNEVAWATADRVWAGFSGYYVLEH
jgi:hypothetical protein